MSSPIQRERNLTKLLLWLPIYLLSVILLSSVLAPLLYVVIDHVWSVLAPLLNIVIDHLNSGLNTGIDHVKLQSFPFRRIFNRAFLLSVAICLLPWMRYWRILDFRRLGLIQPGWWKSLLLWCLLGIVSLIPFLLAHVIWGFRQWQLDLPFPKLAAIVFSSLFVGLVEETVFRGALLLAHREYLGGKAFLWAFIVSVVFGTAHFVQGSDLSQSVSTFSGFEQWTHTFRFEDADSILRLLCLIGVGFALSCLTLRAGTLWPAIGLHAGWVIIMRLSDCVTTNPYQQSSIWFGKDISTGIPVLIFLAILSILFFSQKDKS